MKKTIATLLLTALCLTVLTSCDLSGGLVGELLGEQPADVDVQPVIPGDYYTKIPKLVKVGYLSAVLITDGGRQTIELANADALQNWSGYLEVQYLQHRSSYQPLHHEQLCGNAQGCASSPRTRVPT